LGASGVKSVQQAGVQAVLEEDVSGESSLHDMLKVQQMVASERKDFMLNSSGNCK